MNEAGIKKKEVGRLGEDSACNYLEKEGYKILGRNYKTKYAEIDIVAKKREELVFVEVRTKTNENYGSPEESVNREKMRRLKRSALGYVQKNKYYDCYRIDLICVVLDKQGEIKRFTHHENITL